MSRTSRVPYHQNTYDLLQIEADVSPEAARMIAEHEARYGSLPGSMREWYLIPDQVSLEALRYVNGLEWYARGDDPPRSLPEVLVQFAQMQNNLPASDICFMDGHQGERRYVLRLDGSENPPVYDDAGRPEAPTTWIWWETFSEFVMDCFVNSDEYYHAGDWLRCADEPFQPPVIDFLIDQFGEPERIQRRGNVTTYVYRPTGGTIRVTADDPALTGGLSAWWIHANTPKRLGELASMLFPWGTLRTTLRADTEPARKILQAARA